jgi:hypothetical protein
MDVKGIIIQRGDNKHRVKIEKQMKNGKRLIANRANSLYPTRTT